MIMYVIDLLVCFGFEGLGVRAQVVSQSVNGFFVLLDFGLEGKHIGAILAIFLVSFCHVCDYFGQLLERSEALFRHFSYF